MKNIFGIFGALFCDKNSAGYTGSIALLQVQKSSTRLSTLPRGRQLRKLTLACKTNFNRVCVELYTHLQVEKTPGLFNTRTKANQCAEH
jgi:hypothetical protein